MPTQVTPEERSLAAAMRWQDELASRGSLPAPERALTPLLSLANFNSCPLLQRSDSKLLSAAAAAAQARATVPTSSPSLAEDIKALDPAEETTQCEQVGTTYHECRGTPLKIIQTDISPSVKAKVSPQMATTHLHASSQNSPGTVEAGSGNTQPQSDPEVAQLARLPSAKGHCLSSYPSARPPSPMKHPSARGAPLNGVHASKMLSVKPLGVQPQRPSTAAAILNAAAAAVQAVAGHDGPAEMCGSADSCANLVLVQSEDRQPAVLKHCSQPDSRPLAGPTAGQTPQSAADDIGTAAASTA